jgi:hypothetical protein
VVRIFHGGTVVAEHERVREPHARVVDPRHFDGLWRREMPTASAPGSLSALGRSLADYERAVGGEQ